MIYTSILQFFILPLLLLSTLQRLSTSLSSDNQTEVETIEIYETFDKCNYTFFPRKIINPYKEDISNYVPQKPFGTFYLKCAACLAVAKQINKTIENSINEFNIKQVNENVYDKIHELCTQGFKNYDLRKCKEFNFVTDKFKCTEHVKSNMDGGWTKKLRELCFLYTSHMDLLEYVSNIYSSNGQELSTHLCKGSGLFRDCLNLENETPNELEELCQHCEN